MQEGEKLNLEQIREFLGASGDWEFEGSERREIYEWVTGILEQHRYGCQERAAKGLLRRYLIKMTGLSRAQMTRLIAQYGKAGEVKAGTYRRHRFAIRYTRSDIALLASVDEAHETLSGPATRQILKREYVEYERVEYERLARSRWRKSIAYENARRTGSGVCFSARHGPCRLRLGSGVGRSRRGVLVTCGWTQFIRATGKE